MVFEGVISAVITGSLGFIGYVHQAFSKRIEKIEACNVRNKLEIAKRLTKDDAKEIIEDKLESIHITLYNIQDDIREIKGKV